MGESKIVEKFTMFASKLGNEIHLRSLRDAFATIMPLYILAGLAVLINNTVFQWLLSGDTLTAAQYWGTLIVNGTLNISSLLIAPVIGYMLSQNKGYENPLAAAVISLSTLVVMMPNTISITPLDGTDSVLAQGALTFGNIGTGAMFAGVIIGLVATEVFIFITSIKKLQINLGDSIPPAVGKSFNVLVPFILVVAFVPAFGMMGTLIGLINMLKNLNLDEGGSDTIGLSMSVALVTTLYGVMFANLIFTPIGKKLDIRNSEEILYRQIIIDGVLGIQTGDNPKALKERLVASLSSKQQAMLLESEGGGDGGGKEKKSKKKKEK